VADITCNPLTMPSAYLAKQSGVRVVRNNLRWKSTEWLPIYKQSTVAYIDVYDLRVCTRNTSRSSACPTLICARCKYPRAIRTITRPFALDSLIETPTIVLYPSFQEGLN
jgi:hypothetical protein